MSVTLPVFTRTIDNQFLQTWYDIQKEATDNILNAIVMWALLKSKGCFKTQVGGNLITKTVKYATPTNQVVGVAKGDILPMGEVETQTMAQWVWRYIAAPVQRSTIDDQQNAGTYRIKSYLSQRMEEAREAVQQIYEGELLTAIDTTETANKTMQGLNDLLPPYASRATGTYGKINRSETWWQSKYKQWTDPRAVYMVDDMRNLYNTCGANQSYPDMILTDQTTYELYESVALDQTQIVKTGGGPMVDLGFQVLKFKGADLVWTGHASWTAGNMMFLNSKFIELKYDPNLWFAMSEFKAIPNQMERVAHILSACNLIGWQPRRNGLLYL